MSTEQRIGDWLQVRSGRQFWPLDPRADEIDIDDIAWALSHQCRFSGHVSKFYSVAEHCVRVSYLVPPEDALWALLHDASEAYLIDLPKPLKALPEFAGYRAAEDAVMAAVCERFGLPVEMPETVVRADYVHLCAEARDLMPELNSWWQRCAEPLPWTVEPWTAEEARARFLARFGELTEAPQ
jgi:hypothetical protein